MVLDMNKKSEKSTVDRDRKVNDKELLTFTNLANLDWQFADVLSQNGKGEGLSNNLYEILSDPTNFVRRNEDGEFEKYIYMPNSANRNANVYEKSLGIKELREKAGIAMEYLEKDEGDFLKDWEVIYGADNYKICKDYVLELKKILQRYQEDDLAGFSDTVISETDIAADIQQRDNFHNRKHPDRNMHAFKEQDKYIKFTEAEPDRSEVDIRGQLDEQEEQIERNKKNKINNFPSRREVENNEGLRRLIRIGFFLAETGLTIRLVHPSLAEDYEMGNIAWYISKNTGLIEVRDSLMATEILPLQLLGVVLSNPGALSLDFVVAILKFSCPPISSVLQEKYSYNLEETLEKYHNGVISKAEEKKLESDIKDAIIYLIKNEELELDIIEDFNLDDTGFRVLVLKKGNDIVISYKGAERKKEFLEKEKNFIFPSEYYNMQILYYLLKVNGFLDDNTRITFTGYDKGADISFLNSLFIDKDILRTSHLFYTQLGKIKEYLNFTEKHIDINYDTNLNIVIKAVKDVAFIIGHIMFCGATDSLFFRKDASLLTGLFRLRFIYVAIAIAFTFYAFSGIRRSERAEDIYRKLIELGLVSDIEFENKMREYIEEKAADQEYTNINTVEGEEVIIKAEDVINKLKFKQENEMEYVIKGFIKDKFMKKEYITLKTLDGKGVKVKKEDALYIISREPDLKLNENQGKLCLIDISGLPEKSRKLNNFDLKEFIEEFFKFLDIIVLKKNKDDIYQITRIVSCNYHIAVDPVGDYTVGIKEKIDEKEIIKDIRSGYVLSYVMTFMGILQRAYIDRMSKIRFNYYDYREILIEPSIEKIINFKLSIFDNKQIIIKHNNDDVDNDSNSMSETKHPLAKLHIVDSLKELLEIEKEVLVDKRLSEIKTNEFVFMPLIDTAGNLSNKIRVEYIASVLKSFIHCCQDVDFKKINFLKFYKNFKVYDKNPFHTYQIIFEEEKLEKGEFIEYYMKRVFRELLSPDYISLLKNRKKLAMFNHFGIVQEMLLEDKLNDYLWFYYKVNELDEECFYGSQLVINPEANEKYVMEYKYNPLDCIIGGVLSLDPLKMPDKNDDKQGFYLPSNNSEIRLVHTNTKNKAFSNELTDKLQKQNDVVEICSNGEEDVKVSELANLYKKT